MCMDIKNIILKAWENAKNEHERGLILEQIESARHEIRIEYLWSEPELRSAIASLESKLTSIMRGGYSIAEINPYESDGVIELLPSLVMVGILICYWHCEPNKRKSCAQNFLDA